jgi:hypothetical protein
VFDFAFCRELLRRSPRHIGSRACVIAHELTRRHESAHRIVPGALGTAARRICDGDDEPDDELAACTCARTTVTHTHARARAHTSCTAAMGALGFFTFGLASACELSRAALTDGDDDADGGLLSGVGYASHARTQTRVALVIDTRHAQHSRHRRRVW